MGGLPKFVSNIPAKTVRQIRELLALSPKVCSAPDSYKKISVYGSAYYSDKFRYGVPTYLNYLRCAKSFGGIGATTF